MAHTGNTVQCTGPVHGLSWISAKQKFKETSKRRSLIKLVYFSRHRDQSTYDKRMINVNNRLGFPPNGNRRSYPILGGRLHFVKFETSKINECLDFINSKQLHCGGESRYSDATTDSNAIIKATGGGAHKFADLFKERLGLSLDKEDEMNCLVAGANFLLKVDGDGKYERVNGTNVGGGTYWGLGRLLTKSKGFLKMSSSFDELLELSQKGDNSNTDMLVGDIYGGMDYSKTGLSASTIASSFGKVTSEKKGLDDYRPEDISLSLLRMISYNIAQVS
ncbi:hypothetical protein JHK82_011719 [Glycine max]|nr:hypothetical protein JHK82_011719 [Glycine max]